MINDKFTKIQKLEKDQRLKELQKVHEYMTDFEINDFFYRCNSKLSKVIKSAFDSLQRRMLIKYSEEYEYYILEKEDPFDKNPNSKMIIRSYTAYDDEIEYILKVKRETALKYSCETESQIYLKKKQLPYYKEVNKRIKEEKGWLGLYKIYTINYCRETSIEALQQDQLELQKYGLNDALINFLNEQAQKNYNKTKDIPKNTDQFRYPDSYVGLQEILSYELLNIDENRQKPKLLVEKEEFEEFMANQENVFTEEEIEWMKQWEK
jgi:hypothetical protein